MSFETYKTNRQAEIDALVTEIEAQATVVNTARTPIPGLKATFDSAKAAEDGPYDAYLVAEAALEANPAPVDGNGDPIPDDPLTAEEIALNDAEAALEAARTVTRAARDDLVAARGLLDGAWHQLVDLKKQHEDARLTLADDLADEAAMQTKYDAEVRDALIESVEPGLTRLDRQNLLILKQLRRLGVLLNGHPQWNAPLSQGQARIVQLIQAIES